MAFKLGRKAKPITERTMAFKQASDLSVPGTPVLNKNLQDGILGEANADGTIYVNKNIDPDSPVMKRVLNHEMQHITDMKIGKSTYTDDYVLHDGVMWPRGNGYIMDPHTGKKYKEGDKALPWESNKLD
jgi:hypothetical protein